MPRIFLLLLLPLLSLAANGDSLRQLQQELAQQKYARAATTGLALLRDRPDDLQLLFLTALAFQHNQQPEQASRYYREIINRNPDLPEPMNNLAIIRLQQGDHEEAVDLLVASLKTHPAYATAWQNLSDLYRALASDAYRKTLDETPHGAAALQKIQLASLDQLHQAPDSLEQKPPAKPVIKITRSPIAADSKPATPSPDSPAATQPDPDRELEDIIRHWADAWSGKDFDTYIQAYTNDFKGRQINHQAWVKHRRSRILRPGRISVKVSNIQVRSRSDTRAIIDFHQAFRSPTYRDKVVKRIGLTRVGDRWLIASERTLAVL